MSFMNATRIVVEVRPAGTGRFALTVHGSSRALLLIETKRNDMVGDQEIPAMTGDFAALRKFCLDCKLEANVFGLVLSRFEAGTTSRIQVPRPSLVRVLRDSAPKGP